MHTVRETHIFARSLTCYRTHRNKIKEQKIKEEITKKGSFIEIPRASAYITLMLLDDCCTQN